VYFYQDDDVLLWTNYATQPVTAPRNFYDAASTALITASVYRYALIWGNRKHIPIAEKTRINLSSLNNTSSQNNNSNPMQGLKHFSSQGWLTPVVNPHSYGVQGAESPEAQAFVVQMHAAWRDWVADGSKGANAAVKTRGEVMSWMMVGGIVMGVVGGFVL
jgi:hypothetical protein